MSPVILPAWMSSRSAPEPNSSAPVIEGVYTPPEMSACSRRTPLVLAVMSVAWPRSAAAHDAAVVDATLVAFERAVGEALT